MQGWQNVPFVFYMTLEVQISSLIYMCIDYIRISRPYHYSVITFINQFSYKIHCDTRVVIAWLMTWICFKVWCTQGNVKSSWYWNLVYFLVNCELLKMFVRYFVHVGSANAQTLAECIGEVRIGSHQNFTVWGNCPCMFQNCYISIGRF